jgi:uncharacterized membrane protein
VTDAGLRAAVGTLALAGAAIAGYLTYTKLTDTTIVCATGGCETVQESRYGELAGVPVSALGLLAYLVIAATAWSAREVARLAGAAIAAVGAIFSGYLMVVQVAVIEALCVWCLASDVVISLLTAATLLRLWRPSAAASP